MINKRIFFAILALGIFACTFENSYEPKDESIEEIGPTRYIISFETRDDMEMTEVIFDSLGYFIFYVAENIPTLIVDLPNQRTLQKTFLSTSGEIFEFHRQGDKLTFSTASGGFHPLYFEKDELMYELQPIETYDDSTDSIWPWNLNMIQADQSWNAGIRGDSSVLGILIDSGICDDPELRNTFFASLDTSVCFNPYTDSTDIYDQSGHGSHMFGLWAGQPYRRDDSTSVYIRGVAPYTRIGMIKMFKKSGAGLAIAVKSVDTAISFNPDIISMSWGGGKHSPSMLLLLEKAKENGIVLVAAAGNRGSSPVIYPARYSSVIATGSVDSDTTRSYFSSYGVDLEVVVPGRNILSFWGCSPKKAYGTSMSAPQVAGAIALYIQVYRSLVGADDARPSLMRIRTDLRNSALDLRNSETGFGLLQIMDFLDQLLE